MRRYRLHHKHAAADCPAVFASWRGFASPLRHGVAKGTCRTGGHELWWDVDADSPAAALDMLPDFVADRTQVTAIDDVPIP
jgi:hypothetical protein